MASTPLLPQPASAAEQHDQAGCVEKQSSQQPDQLHVDSSTGLSSAAPNDRSQPREAALELEVPCKTCAPYHWIQAPDAWSVTELSGVDVAKSRPAP